VQLTTKPRMADFARVLATVDQVKSWNTLDDYLSASANVAADALEGDPFGVAIIAFIETHGAWSGTAKQLLELLPPPDGFHPKWPKDPTRAGGRLGRLAPLLRGVGIEVEHGDRAKDRTRSRMIHLAPADRATATESERLDFTEPHLLCPECDLPVDPALTAAGHLTHPSCWDPTEQDPA
jgi:hypothetical protein